MNRFLYILLFTVGFGSVEAQTVYPLDSFLLQVKQHHPLAINARLIADFGDAELRSARGGFDPRVDASVKQKYLDGKQYYSHIQAGLVVPTWFGLALEAGYQTNDGTYLNPEFRTPDLGLWSVGGNITLGAGLLMDERRAALKKAKLFRDQSLSEQQIAYNELLFEAKVAYFDWAFAQQKVDLMNRIQQVGYERLQFVKESAEFGDKAMIDTLEAFTNWQQRYAKYQDYLNELRNKQLKMQVFLWLEGVVPLELQGGVLPQRQFDTQNPPLLSDDELNALVANNPYFLTANLDAEMARIDVLLKREYLRPKLDLSYDLLTYQDAVGVTPALDLSNYMFGAKFSYPILSRAERGNLQQAKIKQQQFENKASYKEFELEQKIRVVLNDWTNAIIQQELLIDNANNYTALMDAEMQLFQNGESSLFVLNSRENSAVNATLKAIESRWMAQIQMAVFDLISMRKL